MGGSLFADSEKSVSSLPKQRVWDLQTYQGEPRHQIPPGEPQRLRAPGTCSLRERSHVALPWWVNTFISNLFSTPC